jgi:hypothetical protein
MANDLQKDFAFSLKLTAENMLANTQTKSVTLARIEQMIMNMVDESTKSGAMRDRLLRLEALSLQITDLEVRIKNSSDDTSDLKAELVALRAEERELSIQQAQASMVQSPGFLLDLGKYFNGSINTQAKMLLELAVASKMRASLPASNEAPTPFGEVKDGISIDISSLPLNEREALRGDGV